jgi:hypothetical protein
MGHAAVSLSEESEQRIMALIEWFRERGIELAFDQVETGWIATMMHAQPGLHTVDYGSGQTRLEAAKDAKARREVTEARTVLVSAHDRATMTDDSIEVTITPSGISSEEAWGIPSVVSLSAETHGASEVNAELDVSREKLGRLAGEFGWRIAFVPWTSGSWLMRVEDDAGRELFWGLASDFDDAKLGSIIDLEPPAGSESD